MLEFSCSFTYAEPPALLLPLFMYSCSSGWLM
nr:MAG: hypothetical protein [Bacteriophage sp.]